MKILLFVADRPFSKAVASYTAILAEATQASVTMLYVASDQEGLRDGEYDLSQTHRLIPQVQVEECLECGDAIEKLLEVIRKDKYDLVVVGARRGLGYFQRKFQSLTKRVIQKSPIPVLMVRYPKRKIKRILICTGGMDVSDRVVEVGAKLAKAANADVKLLHITDVVPSMYTGLEVMQEDLASLLDSATPLGEHLRGGAEILNKYNVDATIEVQSGTVVENILQEARLFNYDLIVLGGSRAADSFTGWISGNVTFQIVERSNRPVLVVR
jgi:nucleotide-binding universal stress UspA family protein